MARDCAAAQPRHHHCQLQPREPTPPAAAPQQPRGRCKRSSSRR